MPNILGLFSKSPFEPLYEHRAKVRECVDLLKPLFEAVFSDHQEEQDRISADIAKAEHDADIFKVEIRRILPKGIFLPVNREDLLRYLKIQDDIADAVEDIMVLLSMKHITAPLALTEQIIRFIDVVLDVCDLADEATDQLRMLVETGFKGEGASEVMRLVEQTEEAERRADNASLDLAKTLFMVEDEMRPTDVFLWFRIFDTIGDIADHAEKSAEWLRNMATR
ncbi:MAG: TIGR00153 family protein [Candidatus Electryoneaceae bacterium]|nr:TIGR00153 family protein [Candidatus Electryoneaceae bacterium]